MVMSRSSTATSMMVSLILLIPAFVTATPVGLPGFSSTLPASSSEQLIEKIIEALAASHDYSNWVEVFAATDPLTFPITATFLAPVDNSFINTATSCPESLSSTISYHIIGQQLPFSVLQTFKIGSRIPTLLPEKTVLVTNNSKSNYTIDGIQITAPDLIMNGAFVVHGIRSTLNYTVFGSEDTLAQAQSTGGNLDNDHDHKTKNETQSGGVLDNDHDHKKKNETLGGGGVTVSSGAEAQLPFNNWGSLINSGVIITCLYLYLG